MRFELSDENRDLERFPVPFMRALGATAVEYQPEPPAVSGRQPQMRYLEVWNDAGRLAISRTDFLTFEAQYRAHRAAQAMVQ